MENSVRARYFARKEMSIIYKVVSSIELCREYLFVKHQTNLFTQTQTKKFLDIDVIRSLFLQSNRHEKN